MTTQQTKQAGIIDSIKAAPGAVWDGIAATPGAIGDGIAATPELLAKGLMAGPRFLSGGVLSGVASAVEDIDDGEAASRLRANELMKNMLWGSAKVGGGVATLAAMAHYMRSLGKEEDTEDRERTDDDTIYIPIEKKAEEEGVHPLLAPGLTVAGGVVASAGTYALVRNIYQKWRKRDLLRKLDSAQRSVLVAGDEEAELAQWPAKDEEK